jgi:hypothetical protein
MRTSIVFVLSALLVGCGLGYQNQQVDRRPDRALGVGATIVNPGESSPALRMPPGSTAASSQTSSSSAPGRQSSSSTSSGNPNVPDDENLTMIGGHSGSAQESETKKEGPAFLPLLGYPFWFLGKSLAEKTDRAVEREGENASEAAVPQTVPVNTPDDAERERLRRENSLLRDQLQQTQQGENRRPGGLPTIADELAALESSLTPSSPEPPPSQPPLPYAGVTPPETADRNGDGRADLWVYNESGGRVKEAVDEDHNGRVDKILYYDAERRLQRSEQDVDGDGLLETVTLFRDGDAVRRRTDSDGDGQTDAWSFYRAGELERHEVDRDGDGFRDLALSYVGGELAQEEEDRNGDGRPDNVTLYAHGEIVGTYEDLDYDGVTDVESVYENGKLVRRNLNSERALRTWQPRGEQ